jgi:hypothetical protein
MCCSYGTVPAETEKKTQTTPNAQQAKLLPFACAALTPQRSIQKQFVT